MIKLTKNIMCIPLGESPPADYAIPYEVTDSEKKRFGLKIILPYLIMT